jgi:arsenate reductase
MDGKKKVVFVCGRNAARSQMAEGFLRALYGERFEAASAGLRPSRVSRTAIRVMAEAGIDISSHRSKSLGELEGRAFDLVVTLCDEAACVPRALLPEGYRYLHREFPDPAALGGSGEEVLAGYRDVRDRIGAWIREEFGPGGRPGAGGSKPDSQGPDLPKT